MQNLSSNGFRVMAISSLFIYFDSFIGFVARKYLNNFKEITKKHGKFHDQGDAKWMVLGGS
jgi:hypothetical protein